MGFGLFSMTVANFSSCLANLSGLFYQNCGFRGPGPGGWLFDPLYLRTFCQKVSFFRVWLRNISVTVPSDLLPKIVLLSGLWAQHFGSGNRLLDPLYLRTFCQTLSFFRVFGRNISVTVPSDLLPKIVLLSGLWTQHFGSGSRETKKLKISRKN